jgi:hypothetical protein
MDFGSAENNREDQNKTIVGRENEKVKGMGRPVSSCPLPFSVHLSNRKPGTGSRQPDTMFFPRNALASGAPFRFFPGMSMAKVKGHP